MGYARVFFGVHGYLIFFDAQDASSMKRNPDQ